MSYWLREIAGWLLVIVGLLIIYECVLFLKQSRVFEAAPLSIIGIIVFRGGIHLLKVAVAARICTLARERTPTAGTARSAPRPTSAARPTITRTQAQGS